MSKVLAVWIGVAALLLWAGACGGEAATNTPSEVTRDVSTPTVSTPEPEATPAASPEDPDPAEPTFTLVPSLGPQPTAVSTTGPDMAQDPAPTTVASATEPVPTQVPGNTAAAPTMAPVEQAATSTSAPPPTSTPTPAPPPTSTPTMEPAPDIPVGSDVGNRAPEFTLTLTEGRTLTSEDLREGGQPFLLFFHSVH